MVKLRVTNNSFNSALVVIFMLWYCYCDISAFLGSRFDSLQEIQIAGSYVQLDFPGQVQHFSFIGGMVCHHCFFQENLDVFCLGELMSWSMKNRKLNHWINVAISSLSSICLCEMSNGRISSHLFPADATPSQSEESTYEASRNLACAPGTPGIWYIWLCQIL